MGQQVGGQVPGGLLRQGGRIGGGHDQAAGRIGAVSAQAGISGPPGLGVPITEVNAPRPSTLLDAWHPSRPGRRRRGRPHPEPLRGRQGEHRPGLLRHQDLRRSRRGRPPPDRHRPTAQRRRLRDVLAPRQRRRRSRWRPLRQAPLHRQTPRHLVPQPVPGTDQHRRQELQPPSSSAVRPDGMAPEARQTVGRAGAQLRSWTSAAITCGFAALVWRSRG
ncbi:hypothetical protein Z951_41990 [Streptomyces sp. PRh5]|nr:hypothetical protein Z951_41990 [Streptomyces sp. PRh5]